MHQRFLSGGLVPLEQRGLAAMARGQVGQHDSQLLVGDTGTLQVRQESLGMMVEPQGVGTGKG
ncbi:hypothetical protein [Modicisalibacter xianhensis]|uniref:hypothetical protein n=1 Tax=Modicisalibacter xianhensis TaxID=442341 RepID=UPI001FBA75E9|nr:hypothetical protein [Halomonas xianhensis]